MALHRRLVAPLIACVFFLVVPLARSQSADAALNLPNDPSANLQQNTPRDGSTSAADSNAASKNSPAQSGSSTQNAQANQPQTAEEQLKQQEKQRILGVMATFNTTQNKDALPLSARQKYHLFFKSVTDPWPFALTGFVAGIGQAEDSTPEYGQGMKGYAKRYGASYTDYFTGNFFGNAVLPSLLHEDPRYFQKGTGSFTRRALWAAGSTVWSKRDDGTWGPNYSNVAGNLIGAAVSNLYYPAANRTVDETIERAATVTVEGIAGAELIEFWPDVVRHYRRKKAEKLARRAAQRYAQPGPASPARSHQN